jgi:hypothetical protein
MSEECGFTAICSERLDQQKADIVRILQVDKQLNDIKEDLHRLGINVASLVENVNVHKRMLEGVDDKPGIKDNVRVLVEERAERKKQNAAIMGGIALLLVKAIWDLMIN